MPSPPPSMMASTSATVQSSVRQNLTELERQELAQEVLQGIQRIVTFPGSSQYGRTGGGLSACGLAALNCARIILQRERNGLKDLQLLETIMRRETLQNILGICQSWSNSSHLEVDAICKAPVFAKTLELKAQEYGPSEYKHLSGLLQRAKATVDEPPVAVVITRPPEIILCVIINVGGKNVYITFDSHPRPKHPNGAAFIFDIQLPRIASYLTQLLGYDPYLLADQEIQWEAQMLAQYSGHIFVAKDTPDIPADWMQGLLEASLSALSLKADLDSLQSRNDSLASENVRLGRDVRRLQTELGSVRQQHQEQLRRVREQNNRSAQSKKDKGKMAEWSLTSWIPYPSTRRVSPDDRIGHVNPWKTLDDFKEDAKPRATSEPLVTIKGDDNVAIAGTPITEGDEDLDYVIQLQLEYDLEDARLRSQMEQLQGTAQRTFDCTICFETMPDDYIAPLDSCKHQFCMVCLRDYVRSKLEEGRFPVFCPVCITSRDTDSSERGVISNGLAQQIGLSEKDFQTFVEFELTAFSILLHCRRCKQSVFVDKEEYNAAEFVTCPLPNCQYTWCRRCSQEAANNTQHSCDGSTELQNLMQQRGWKNCPGCKTPAEKTEGCNHMTCPAPGCNSHFCYRCGDMIVQSVRSDDIRREVSAHYSRCQLFQYD